MIIYLKRMLQHENGTVGRLSVPNCQPMFCIEDRHHDSKVYGKTRIPAGDYDIKPVGGGRIYTRYTARWEWHRGCLFLQNVPNYTGVMIHCGNSAADTEGCLLPTLSADLHDKCWGGYSRQAYALLYKAVVGAAYNSDLMVRIRDEE